MGEVKLVVIYPRPTDVDAFEKAYLEEHIPMAMEKLVGVTKALATRVISSPSGEAPFHRIAEIYFHSIEALQACAASPGGQETIAHATAMSTGGAPIMLITEEEPFRA